MIHFKQTYSIFPKYCEMRLKSLFFKSYPFGAQNPLDMIIPLRFDFILCSVINVLTDRAERAINFVVSVYFSFSQGQESCQKWRFIWPVPPTFRSAGLYPRKKHRNQEQGQHLCPRACSLRIKQRNSLLPPYSYCSHFKTKKISVNHRSLKKPVTKSYYPAITACSSFSDRKSFI